MTQTSSFLSRQDLTDRIRQTRTWESLFEAANEALSSRREALGDPLEIAAHSAHVWGSAVFPVCIGNTIRVFQKSNQGVYIYGEDFARRSFKMAQTLACRLLSPVEDMEEWCKIWDGAEDSLLLRLYLGSGFTYGLRSAMDSTRRKGALVSMERHFSWDAVDAYLKGNIHRIDHRQLRGEGFEDEESHNRHDQLRTYLATFPDDDGVLERLRDNFGFQWVALGPMGGLRRGQQVAHAVEAAFSQLARTMAMPDRLISLDGMMLQLNGVVQGTLAHYSSRQNGILVGAFPTSIAHEWTHALDHWTRRQKDPELSGALQSLRDSIDGGREGIPTAYLEDSRKADEKRGHLKRRALLRQKGRGAPVSDDARIPDYFSRPGELLARASETFFANTHLPALAQSPDAYDRRPIYPRGAERALIHTRLQGWFDAARVKLEALPVHTPRQVPFHHLIRTLPAKNSKAETVTTTPLSSPHP